MGRIVAGANWAGRRRSLVCPVLMSLGVGMLAGCAEPPPPPRLHTVAVEPPRLQPPLAPPPRRAFPLPARKPAPPPANDTGGAPHSDEAMAMASPEPAPSNPPPVGQAVRASDLIGLDQPAATDLLGTASERSSSPPATIWRYRSATCELDLFFYLDLRSGKMRTLHYAFKGNATDQTEREECLRSLVVARRS